MYTHAPPISPEAVWRETSPVMAAALSESKRGIETGIGRYVDTRESWKSNKSSRAFRKVHIFGVQ